MQSTWTTLRSRMTGFAALCALTLLLAAQSFAANEDLDFTLHNKTGFTITNIYIGPSTSDEWGDDVLGEDEVLRSGQKMELSFHPKAKAKKWDIKVVDKGGTSYEWTGFDLTEITDIILYYKNGNCTAVTKNGDE